MKNPDRIWMVFCNNKNNGPFILEEVFNIIKSSEDKNLMLVKNTAKNKLFTTDFFINNYKNNKYEEN